MYFANQKSMALDGLFGKRIRYDMAGQKQVLIDGYVKMLVTNELQDKQEYAFTVTEPMVMTGNCRWMETGAIDLHDQNQQYLGKIQLDTTRCSANYQLTLADGSAVAQARQHSLWN